MSLEKKIYQINDIFIDVFIYTDTNGIPWFKAKEIAIVLEYSNTVKAINSHVYKDCRIKWEKLNKLSIDSPKNWQGNTIFINESGLYSLIYRSTKPEADKFRRWIVYDVLPSIRKTGSYNISKQEQQSVEDQIKDQQIAIYRKQLTEDRERMIAKDQQIAEDRERMIAKDQQIAEDRKELLANQTMIVKLMNTILDIEPRVAVMPDTKTLKHSLYLLKKNNCTYKIVRAQNRSTRKQVEKYVADGYSICLHYNDIANAMNILNKCKEHLKKNNIQYTAVSNEITTTYNISKLFMEIVSNPIKNSLKKSVLSIENK